MPRVKPSLARFVPAVAFLLLALAWTWPLPLHLGNRFAHDPGDPLLVTYLLWWNARVVPLSDAMWNAPFYWPMRGALALTEHGAGMAVITSPVQWLGGSPLLAYNILLVAAFWGSGLATYALVRRLTGSAAAGFCAGIAFAFAPYRASQLAHLHLLVTWWMPLALLALHRYYDEGGVKWLVVFGVSWLLQALTNGYYLLFFPILVVLWLAVFTPWRTRPRRVLAVAAAWIVFSLPLVPVLLKYYTVQTAQGLTRSRIEMQGYSATLASFAHSSPLLRFWPADEAGNMEDSLFPGATALALVAAGLLLYRWRGSEARRFFFFAGTAAFMTWLAFGPAPDPRSLETLWHPYQLIAWLPGYSGLRVPERFFMLATLCLAVGAGLAVAGLRRAYQRYGTVIAIAAVLGLLADGWIGAMPLGVPARRFATTLARGAVVLELPVTDDRVNVNAMYRGTLHGLPVVNGYSGYVPPYLTVLDWALSRKDPSVLTELRRGRTLYVAVANHDDAPVWSAFIESQSDVKLLEVGGGGRLYELPPAPYARQVTLGPATHGTALTRGDGWLTIDLGSEQTIRAVQLQTRGHVVLLRATLRVETSTDGETWTKAADEPTGGLALNGVLSDPRAVPVRVVLPDPHARFIRLDTPAFTASAVTVYGAK